MILPVVSRHPRLLRWEKAGALVGLVAVVVLCAGCGDDGRAPAVGSLSEECGLRPAKARVRASEVHPAFLPDHSELVDVHKPRIGGMSAVVNLAYPVEETFELYKAASKHAGFEVTSVDFEGFEAEIWLRNRKELGSIVVRGSACEDASGAIISIVAKKDLEG